MKDEKKMCGVFAAASLGVMVGVHQLASSVVQQYFLFLCVGGMEVDSCLLRDEITIDTITQEWRVIIFLFLIVRWYSVANNVTYFRMERKSQFLIHIYISICMDMYPRYIYDHEGKIDGTQPPTPKNVANVQV